MNPPDTVPAQGTPRRWSPPAPSVVVAVVVIGLAVASLALPVTLAFDPWAWLTWGREVGRLGLDTTGGPSWKPLPVLVTTLLAPAGSAAPLLWLLIARAASLLSIVGLYRLGERLAGRAAGVVAAGLLVLTPDTGSRFLRLLLEGHSATIGVALAIWAVLRHLDGARTHALLLATGFALIRPEAWPFLGLYATWLWWDDRPRRPLVAVSLLAIPVLWLGGDWWGSGSPWHGADAAQVASGSAADRLTLALESAWEVVPLPVWVLAALALLLGRRARDPILERTLALAALAWIALVVAMAATLGYAALSRFYLPAGAVLCALAGVGAERLVRRATAPRLQAALVVVIVLASLPGLVPRITALDRLFAEAHTRHRLSETLDAAIEAADGASAVLACGTVAIDQAGMGGPMLPGLAWKLDVPLHRVKRRLGEDGGILFARVGGRAEARLLAGSAEPPARLAHTGDWAVYAVGCPASAGD